MAAGSRSFQRGENPPECGRAEAADRFRRQLQPAGLAADVPLPFQFAFDVPQPAQIVYCTAAECAPDRFLINVVEAGAGIILRKRGGDFFEIRELLENRRRIRGRQWFVAAEPGPADQSRSGRRRRSASLRRASSAARPRSAMT